MKIKTKKEMNLPQFIAWAVDNHITGSFYANNRVNAKRIRFEFGGIVSSHGELRSHDTFTVEVEEEITLTTPLPDMLHVWKTGMLGTEIKEVQNKSIASQYTVCSTEFWLKQDDEMTLIWRDGKLVE